MPAKFSSSPHLVAVITPHGFGHAAIVTAVLDTLWRLRPDVRVTLVAALPESMLRARLPGIYDIVPYAGPADFGMVMASTTEVKPRESAERYRAAHLCWQDTVAEMQAVLAPLHPDLVLTSASYVALEAAARLKVAGAGFGPFSWLDVFAAYCRAYPGADAVSARMRAAYETARVFLRTKPGVDTALENVRDVGPVALPGRCRRKDLVQAGAIREGDKMAYVSFGGLPEALPIDRWRAPEGWRWLVPDGPAGSSSVVRLRDVGVSVADGLASADAVITKPGYGTFVEAACAGLPLFYKDRPDWPETTGMHAWYAAAGLPIHRIGSETFASGAFARHLRMHPAKRPKATVTPTGNAEAAAVIAEMLG